MEFLLGLLKCNCKRYDFHCKSSRNNILTSRVSITDSRWKKIKYDVGTLVRVYVSGRRQNERSSAFYTVTVCRWEIAFLSAVVYLHVLTANALFTSYYYSVITVDFIHSHL